MDGAETSLTSSGSIQDESTEDDSTVSEILGVNSPSLIKVTRNSNKPILFAKGSSNGECSPNIQMGRMTDLSSENLNRPTIDVSGVPENALNALKNIISRTEQSFRTSPLGTTKHGVQRTGISTLSPMMYKERRDGGVRVRRVTTKNGRVFADFPRSAKCAGVHTANRSDIDHWRDEEADEYSGSSDGYPIKSCSPTEGEMDEDVSLGEIDDLANYSARRDPAMRMNLALISNRVDGEGGFLKLEDGGQKVAFGATQGGYDGVKLEHNSDERRLSVVKMRLRDGTVLDDFGVSAGARRTAGASVMPIARPIDKVLGELARHAPLPTVQKPRDAEYVKDSRTIYTKGIGGAEFGSAFAAGGFNLHPLEVSVMPMGKMLIPIESVDMDSKEGLSLSSLDDAPGSGKTEGKKFIAYGDMKGFGVVTSPTATNSLSVDAFSSREKIKPIEPRGFLSTFINIPMPIPIETFTSPIKVIPPCLFLNTQYRNEVPKSYTPENLKIAKMLPLCPYFSTVLKGYQLKVISGLPSSQVSSPSSGSIGYLGGRGGVMGLDGNSGPTFELKNANKLLELTQGSQAVGGRGEEIQITDTPQPSAYNILVSWDSLSTMANFSSISEIPLDPIKVMDG